MGSYSQFMLVSDDLQAEDVSGDWFSDICTVEHISQVEDGVRLRLDRSLDTENTRAAAGIAFGQCSNLEFFIHAFTQNTIMASVAHMYERWDWQDEGVGLVVDMRSGDSNWQEPFRYFAHVHGITVEQSDPSWPPRAADWDATRAEREQEITRRWESHDDVDTDTE